MLLHTDAGWYVGLGSDHTARDVERESIPRARRPAPSRSAATSSRWSASRPAGTSSGSAAATTTLPTRTRRWPRCSRPARSSPPTWITPAPAPRGWAGYGLPTAGFAVNILSARQEAISNRFARCGEDHFADVPLDGGPLGVPLIRNAVAHVTCRVAREIDGGVHVIVLGDVVHVQQRDGLPLCFFSGTYGDFHDSGNPAEFWYF